jgi:hypothetical protein
MSRGVCWIQLPRSYGEVEGVPDAPGDAPADAEAEVAGVDADPVSVIWPFMLGAWIVHR